MQVVEEFCRYYPLDRKRRSRLEQTLKNELSRCAEAAAAVGTAGAEDAAGEEEAARDTVGGAVGVQQHQEPSSFVTPREEDAHGEADQEDDTQIFETSPEVVVGDVGGGGAENEPGFSAGEEEEPVQEEGDSALPDETIFDVTNDDVEDFHGATGTVEQNQVAKTDDEAPQPEEPNNSAGIAGDTTTDALHAEGEHGYANQYSSPEVGSSSASSSSTAFHTLHLKGAELLNAHLVNTGLNADEEEDGVKKNFSSSIPLEPLVADRKTPGHEDFMIEEGKGSLPLGRARVSLGPSAAVPRPAGAREQLAAAEMVAEQKRNSSSPLDRPSPKSWHDRALAGDVLKRYRDDYSESRSASRKNSPTDPREGSNGAGFGKREGSPKEADSANWRSAAAASHQKYAESLRRGGQKAKGV